MVALVITVVAKGEPRSRPYRFLELDIDAAGTYTVLQNPVADRRHGCDGRGFRPCDIPVASRPHGGDLRRLRFSSGPTWGPNSGTK